MSDPIDLNEPSSSPEQERDQRGSGIGGGIFGSTPTTANNTTNTTNSQNQYSSNSSIGSKSNRSGRSRRYRYRGRMLTVKAMDALPPVNENHLHGPNAINSSDYYNRSNMSGVDNRTNRRNTFCSKFCLSPFDATSRKTFYLCIFAFATYLFIGTLTYSLWIPSWNVVDAMYFTVATFTTVGYGDIIPMDDGQRAFTLLFVMSGTFLSGGIFFGYLFHFMYNAFEDITAEAKQMTSEYFIHRLDHGHSQLNMNMQMNMNMDDNGMGSTMNNSTMANNMMYHMNPFHEDVEPFWTDLCRTFTKTVPLLCALIVPPLIMGYYEEWNVLSSFYYTVITASTVGYGDIAPKNTWMRLIAVFYLPICIYVMARTFSKLTAVYLRHKARAAEEQYFNRNLTEADLEQMDIEGGGSENVGYDEFLVFMLVAMGRVSPEDIQKMEELYQRLDADSEGALKVEDLFTMAYGEIKEL